MNFDIWKLLAGLVFFLLAMSILEEAIRSLAGSRMKAFISRNTHTPLRGLLSGTLATAVLQSSSLVGLLVLAFVGAKIMKLKDALLILFGANLGTTATGWIVALIGFKLDLGAVSLPLIALGGLFWVTSGSRPGGNYGRFFLGLGMLLFALQFMKTAVGDAESVVSPEFFLQFSAWQFLLFGIIFSAVVQSSSAVMVVTLSALYSGMLDLSAAAAVMIGADLGTTSTVMLGSIGGSPSKKRVALGHVLFNIITDLIAFALLVPLVTLVSHLGDPLMSLVAFHSLFNLIGVGLCTPLVSQFARFLEARFSKESETQAKYLDSAMLEIVDVAVTALSKEVAYLAERVCRQNATLFQNTDGDMIDKSIYKQSYTPTKQLEGEILEFSLDLDLKESSHDMRALVERLLAASRSLLLSSKLCKDNINDLLDMADYLPDLHSEFLGTQHAFYEEFLEVGTTYGLIQLDQMEEFIQLARDKHDQMHARIYELIKSDQIPSNKMSTVLNVNREFYNSNISLLAGLAALAGNEWVSKGSLRVV